MITVAEAAFYSLGITLLGLFLFYVWPGVADIAKSYVEQTNQYKQEDDPK